MTSWLAVSFFSVLALAANAAPVPAACRDGSSSIADLIRAEPGLRQAVWVEFHSLQLCLALAQPAPDRCEPLKDSRHACRNFYAQARFSKAALSGSAGEGSACAAMFEAEGDVIPAGTAAQACAALKLRDIPKTCAVLRRDAKTSDKFTLDTCEADFKMILGEAGACAAAPPDARELCEGVAAFRLLKSGGRGEACRAQPFCRVLLGEGMAACAPLAARLEAKVCGERRDEPKR